MKRLDVDGRRIALVTGATSGIGLHICRLFLENGIHVLGCGSSAQRVNAVRRQFGLRRDGPAFLGFQGDLRSSYTIVRAHEECLRWAGRYPDISVVNAGVGLPGTLLSSDQKKWRELFELNVLAAMEHLKCAALCMTSNGKKLRRSEIQDIVVLGSIVGKRISPGNPVYGATKFAIGSVTEALRQEVCSKGIRVTLVEPGFVATDFQRRAGYALKAFKEAVRPIEPLLGGEDIARAVLFAVQQPAHVNISEIQIRPTKQKAP